MPYLVTKEYSEGYAPGNWSVDLYWQSDNTFYYYDLEIDANNKKIELEKELPEKKIYKSWRINMIEMKNGQHFQIGEDVQHN